MRPLRGLKGSCSRIEESRRRPPMGAPHFSAPLILFSK